ncbi:hypothetical protein CN617_26660 [Bacillus wiedmannii]|nr:hypothetical protein CN617_26660 [Bacillus wiedmannii]
MAHQEGTTITFSRPTDILLEGDRTYLFIYKVQVVAPGPIGVSMFLNNALVVGSEASLSFFSISGEDPTSIGAPAIFHTPPGPPSVLQVRVVPPSPATVNTFRLTVTVVTLT